MVKVSGSGEADFIVFLILLPLPMYFAFMLAGTQFGRLVQRDADNSSGVEFTWLGALDNVTKALWDSNAMGRPRGGRHNYFWPTSVISMGPWGGSGGQPFYMSGTSAPHLRSIVVYHSGAIHFLACKYTYGDSWWSLSDSYGSRGVVRTEIDLASSGEHITAVEGTTGHFPNIPGTVITSLAFRTSSGGTYGPYGNVTAGSHYFFSIPAADGACIIGFWGRSGWLLDAVGVYIKPSCSSPPDTAPEAYKKHASRREGRN